MFLLENVKQLRGHDKGRTLQTIMSVLKGEHTELPENLSISAEARKALSEKLDYWVDFKVLRSCDFGVPQNRQRVYIVGFDRNYYGEIDFENSFSWPTPTGIPTSVRQILQSHNEVDEKVHDFPKTARWPDVERESTEKKGMVSVFPYSRLKIHIPTPLALDIIRMVVKF